MTITPHLFSAFLKCPTKCWLLATSEPPSGNAFADWVKSKNETYRSAAVEKLQANTPEGQIIHVPTMENLKAANWRLAVDMFTQAQLDSCLLETRLPAVERIPSKGRGKPDQLIPVRFVFRNKLGEDEKLTTAFDVLLFSKILGREVSLGKIIHGDETVAVTIKTSVLVGEVRKRVEEITGLLSNTGPPDLVLNRHCAECEFQARCRKIAIEKDDLSLLAGMGEKERQKLRSKGIFTVTQLSYTFRPRRRPKRLRDKREQYHHSLKALAIREKRTHIVGTPELKIEGTPVYFDVEGLPDRDFYYLIGARVTTPESVVERSFWADRVDGEKSAWNRFTDMLADIQNPVLLHYGSYETHFLKKMCERYGQPPAESTIARAINSAVNVLSPIFAQVYFPTYSNGLKEIAGYLGFLWSDCDPSGLKAVIWRHEWEQTKAASWKEQLLKYNADDCRALECVAGALVRLGETSLHRQTDTKSDHAVVHTELIPHQTMWPRFSSPLPEFEQVNKAARWDYQRERVYVRSSKRIRRIANRSGRARKKVRQINKRIVVADESHCPKCGSAGWHQDTVTKVLHDLRFSQWGLKKWVVEYKFRYYWCRKCQFRFGVPGAFWPGSKFGRNLLAYITYQMVDLNTPQATISRTLKRFFAYDFGSHQINRFKVHAAAFFRETRQVILDRIVRGGLVHVDETRANVRGKTAYVWVFANLHGAVFLYSQSREGEIAQTTLANFKGVLISDFYSAYDSLRCPQQKCLLHLMRDLNAEILRNPYDEELKVMINGFAQLLKEIVETIDRFGLKRHFLHKHHRSVDRFYRRITVVNPKSEAALKCKQRFEKNREKLFTFLDYDGVPWNNNNAEHAIKAFASLRDVMEGSSTEKGIEDYLILLSVCQTCKYMGVDFLDFLRSREKDIHAFAEGRRGQRQKRCRPGSLADAHQPTKTASTDMSYWNNGLHGR